MGEQHLRSEVTSERAPKKKMNLGEQRVEGIGLAASSQPWEIWV